MQIYVDLVMILNFLVDFLLLIATNRLAGYHPGAGRAALAGVLGGVYAGACLIPGFSFLSSPLWLLVSLVLMVLIAFGYSKSALRRGVLFILLSMALGGMAMGLGSGSFAGLAAVAAGLCLMCLAGFGGQAGQRQYVPVTLSTGDRTVHLTALHDTGNNLRDPVTGEGVLIAGPKVAASLLGLTREQLLRPVETVSAGKIQGLRLIPYRAVGQPGGMLLAMRFQNTTIGKRHGSTLVAFAAEEFDSGNTYQALTGGAMG